MTFLDHLSPSPSSGAGTLGPDQVGPVEARLDGTSAPDGTASSAAAAARAGRDPSRRTILIYRLGSLGDTIVSLPCFHKVAERFPDARRVVLTNRPVSKAAPRLADILDGSDLVHGTIEYELALRSPSEFARLWTQLRGLRADTLVYLAAPRGRARLLRDLAFFRSFGIRRVVGAPRTADLQANRTDPASGEEEHECERLVRCLAELGAVDLRSRSSWDLRLSDRERDAGERALELLGGRATLAVSMGGKALENDWGEANWRALLGELGRSVTDLRVAFVGGAGDAARAATVSAGLDGRFLNLCGELSPRGTASVLSRADLFAGHDSGPLHLAAACGVPCVGIFSNRHRPHKWHPYGERHRIIHPSGPIASVPVAQVRDAVEGAMSASVLP